MYIDNKKTWKAVQLGWGGETSNGIHVDKNIVTADS